MSRRRHEPQRRSLLQGTAAAIAAANLPRLSHAAELPLDAYDPMSPLDGTLEKLFNESFVQADGARKTTEKLWTAFEKTRNVKYAEWAVQFAFIWWRDTVSQADRIRVSKIGQRMAEPLIAANPNSVPGLIWQASFFGFEALSRGVLNALHVVPAMLDAADKANALDPTYMYGLPTLLHARMLFKAPPFPVSRGDLKKSLMLLEKVRPLAEKKFGTWYLFYAEALHLNGQPEAARDVIENWENAVKPSKKVELLTIGMTRVDMANFKVALDTGKYDRYLWDAFMIPITRAQLKEQFNYLMQRYVR